jgi:hypothetical protein
MDLVISACGQVRTIYAEVLDLAAFGRPDITRASHVEPDELGCWHADLAPVGGPILGPFARRGEALAAEHDWLVRYWLLTQG